MLLEKLVEVLGDSCIFIGNSLDPVDCELQSYFSIIRDETLFDQIHQTNEVVDNADLVLPFRFVLEIYGLGHLRLSWMN